MGRAVVLRQGYKGSDLRRLAKVLKDAGQSRRLLALADIYGGGKRMDAVRVGDVGLQVIRDWVLRFNADGPNGLIDRKALAQIVEDGPIVAIDDVVRWRLKDLALWIFAEFHISVDKSTVSWELKALGFSKITARPQHRGQNEFSGEDFKKTSPSYRANKRRLKLKTSCGVWWPWSPRCHAFIRRADERLYGC